MQLLLMSQNIIIITTLCVLFFSNAVSEDIDFNIRFRDDQMMRKHHNHQNSDASNITVHLIPHSHDDVGWLKTVDEYYYGSRQDVQWAGVQYTIDTVVSELAAHPEYKFSIVEVAFLYRWWNNADETQRQQMKELVKNGQIQFINGGWCMSDEATVYYQDFIDQMTVGLRWLKETFDYIPQIAWHIDPFGHQSSSASMFSKMGMQAFFFARIDYQDKEKRMAQKNLQMIWAPHTTVEDQTNYVFTHVNYYHYSPPPGFCFDLVCKNQPIKDDPTLEDFNVDKRSDELVDYFKSMALHFKSNNLMHTLGEDFQFANSRMWFKNFDKLIKYINDRPEYGVKLIYSTPGAYIKQINSEDISFQTKTDDFFPYADHQNAYWTGYFTSRVAVKGFVRDFGRWLQAMRKYVAECQIRGSQIIQNNKQQLQKNLWQLQTAMGILQHHDGVSGTQKQRVADDYIATALRAINKFIPTLQKIQKETISKQINQNPKQDDIHFNIYWNETAKQTGIDKYLTANKTVVLSLYNPGHAQNRQIRVSVTNHDLKVVNAKNQEVHGDVFCASTWDASHCQLIFTASLTQSSHTYYRITPDTKSPTAKVIKLKELSLIESSKGFNLTSTATLKVTKSTGKISLTLGKQTEDFSIGYNYYHSYEGQGQQSGAYIFRPQKSDSSKYSSTKTIHYAQGSQGVFLCFEGDKISNKIFFSKENGYIESKGFEIESRIDSISVADKIGKQITLNFITSHTNNQTFYTDSNGLEEQVRILNQRPTWQLVVNQPVAGNYYPINSHIGFVDTNTKKKITILTDRSEGGSMIRNGQIQLMIHRRLMKDDARGVGEPLSETQPNDQSKGLIQNVRHYVVFGDNYRDVQMQNDQKVAISFYESSQKTFSKHEISDIPIKVPEGVKLYLRPYNDDSYLLRVQNFKLAKATMKFPDEWQATEYTLSFNQLQEDWKNRQYKWKSSEDTQEQENKSIFSKFFQIIAKIYQFFFSQVPKELQNNEIQINFLQIRTFKIQKN